MSIDKTNLSHEFVIPEGEQEIYELIGKTIRDARVARTPAVPSCTVTFPTPTTTRWPTTACC